MARRQFPEPHSKPRQSFPLPALDAAASRVAHAAACAAVEASAAAEVAASTRADAARFAEEVGERAALNAVKRDTGARDMARKAAHSAARSLSDLVADSAAATAAASEARAAAAAPGSTDARLGRALRRIWRARAGEVAVRGGALFARDATNSAERSFRDLVAVMAAAKAAGLRARAASTALVAAEARCKL